MNFKIGSMMRVVVFTTTLLANISVQSAATYVPDCAIDDVMGTTFYLDFFSLCLEIEIIPDGVVSLVDTDFTNPVCTEAYASTAIKKNISVLQTPVTGTEASFDGSSFGASGWSGSITFIEDDTASDYSGKLLLADSTTNSFSLELTLLSCEVPSLAPSSIPTLVPSAKPSLAPSILPTRVPECEISEVSGLGSTYFLPVLNLCLKLELWESGNLDLIQTSLNNAECTATQAASLPTQTLSTWTSATTSEATYNGAYDGTVIVRQDVVTEINVDILDLDTAAKTFAIEIVLPSCEAPSSAPSGMPTLLPSAEPSDLPSSKPSQHPSDVPSVKPSLIPSAVPSSLPSLIPSQKPSAFPSDIPSAKPSLIPSAVPSYMPSLKPSLKPSVMPSTIPSVKPSSVPSLAPSSVPSLKPSLKPSVMPSSAPSSKPSSVPSLAPSSIPSLKPSLKPSAMPSSAPSSKPSVVPSLAPSSMPSSKPSLKPSVMPSSIPSSKPSAVPSLAPSSMPSSKPSLKPSAMPSSIPSVIPSAFPSLAPSSVPSILPTRVPECLVEEVRGKTYYLQILSLCLKVEMFSGGTLKILDSGTLISPMCRPDISPAPEEELISHFDDDSSSPLSASFTDKLIVGGGWNGDFRFTQDTISDIQVNINTLDSQNKILDLEVVLPSCEAPSSAPSSMPSATCPAASFLGQKYYTVTNVGGGDICLELNLTAGQQVNMSTQPATACNETDFVSASGISVLNTVGSNTFTFIPGSFAYSGEIIIKLDASASAPGITVTVDTASSSFTGVLVVLAC